ncbi:hypothetical protein K469DRAFT_603375 [Zopfia rhizophila CBS 207.26]|uniref:Rhodopsin domain-containing protein n=1 Tax=Zopfia rhizophila CBS 207.26 TaxID=1314779 RepID=A0A6A6DGA1_9PEZI|nr:hypothetical protein K469DRAFT_603375 [Zopfia rhizophila CBS 207.26]
MSAPAAYYSPEYLAEDIGPSILATSSLFIIFSTVFVALRYYARYLTQTKFGIEDVIIPFAWLAEVGICIVGILMVEKASTGRHIVLIEMTDPGKITIHYQGILVHEFLHLPAVAFSKLCVAFLYLRVFTNKFARIATYVLICLIFGTWVAYTIAAMFQCTPFAFNWDKTIPGGKCFNITVFSKSSSVPNIVTDVAVMLLPIRTVMDLKVSIGRRIGLLLIFLTGSVGIVASIIRTVVFSNIDALDDITFTNTQLVNWTIIEPGFYLLAACALSFKPLFSMVAKILHLESLLTHTRSLAGKHVTRASRNATASSGIHLGTIKSSHSGFKKTHTGQDLEDQEAETQWKSQGGLRVTVTKTTRLDVDVQSRDESFYLESPTESNHRPG